MMMFHNTKAEKLLILISVVLCISVSGHVLASLLATPAIEGPVVVGTLTMALKVADVEDLYGWQVAIEYSQGQFEVLEVAPGGFVGEDFPYFVSSTDSAEDLLLLGGTLHGGISGKNYRGTLAIIVFGYYTENYDEPAIVNNEVFETFLVDSQIQPIPIGDSTLTLAAVETP